MFPALMPSLGKKYATRANSPNTANIKQTIYLIFILFMVFVKNSAKLAIKFESRIIFQGGLLISLEGGWGGSREIGLEILTKWQKTGVCVYCFFLVGFGMEGDFEYLCAIYGMKYVYMRGICRLCSVK